MAVLHTAHRVKNQCLRSAKKIATYRNMINNIRSILWSMYEATQSRAASSNSNTRRAIDAFEHHSAIVRVYAASESDCVTT